MRGASKERPASPLAGWAYGATAPSCLVHRTPVRRSGQPMHTSNAHPGTTPECSGPPSGRGAYETCGRRANPRVPIPGRRHRPREESKRPIGRRTTAGAEELRSPGLGPTVFARRNSPRWSPSRSPRANWVRTALPSSTLLQSRDDGGSYSHGLACCLVIASPSVDAHLVFLPAVNPLNDDMVRIRSRARGNAIQTYSLAEDAPLPGRAHRDLGPSYGIRGMQNPVEDSRAPGHERPVAVAIDHWVDRPYATKLVTRSEVGGRRSATDVGDSGQFHPGNLRRADDPPARVLTPRPPHDGSAGLPHEDRAVHQENSIARS